MNNKIIAVDFDGTLCENAWPGIGEPRQAVIDYVQDARRNGARLILWTNRSGDKLKEALAWCAEQGIVFDAVNENLSEMIEKFGGDCRKVFANEYIDDRAIPMPEDESAGNDARDYIRRRLGEPELLAQLAEEAAELAQAALKYRRAMSEKNPTPVTRVDAAKHLLEEMADVELCMYMLNNEADDVKIADIMARKANRWFNRLKDAED